MSFAKAKNMQCYIVWHLISHTISCRNYQSEIIRNKEKHRCKAKKSKTTTTLLPENIHNVLKKEKKIYIIKTEYGNNTQKN